MAGNITEFRAASMRLAIEHSYPVVLPSGAFVADASVAWLLEAVEDWHLYSRVPRHDPGWFHCSNLGATDEQLIAAYRGEEGEVHSAQTLRVLDNGTSRDRDWKRYFKDAGVLVGRKAGRRVRFPKLRLRGECDAVVEDTEGLPWVVEVKTINPFEFGKLVEPKLAHLMQLTCYMQGLKIPRGIVLYEGKGNQALKAFHVPLDPTVWGSIVDRLTRLRDEAEDAKFILEYTK